MIEAEGSASFELRWRLSMNIGADTGPGHRQQPCSSPTQPYPSKRKRIGKRRSAAYGCLAYDHPVALHSSIVALGKAVALLSVAILRAGVLHLCSVPAYFIGQHGCSRIDAHTLGRGGNTGCAIPVFVRPTLTSRYDAGSAVPGFRCRALVGDRRVDRRVCRSRSGAHTRSVFPR